MRTNATRVDWETRDDGTGENAADPIGEIRTAVDGLTSTVE